MVILSCLIIQTVPADLTVHFLDVNGGDAVLLEKEGHAMLIDAGPADSGNLTRLYLKSLNITSLDSVLITRPEEGHTGAMTNILNATPALECIISNWTSSDGSYLDILNKLQSEQIPLVTVIPGDMIRFSDDITIQFLKQSNKTGDYSPETLIPMITDDDIRFLLLGENSDLSGNTSAQILRVADHGSMKGTETAGLNRISPEVAIISTGIHAGDAPSPATLANLENAGASVLRTDYDGTITIKTDGKRYSYGKLRMEPEMTISLVSVVETRPPG